MSKRRPLKLPRRTVALTEPQWRAVAAMLWVAANSGVSSQTQSTLFFSIYQEVAKQINFVPQKIEEEEGDDESQE